MERKLLELHLVDMAELQDLIEWVQNEKLGDLADLFDLVQLMELIEHVLALISTSTVRRPSKQDRRPSSKAKLTASPCRETYSLSGVTS